MTDEEELFRRLEHEMGETPARIDAHTSLMKATRGLVALWGHYNQTEDDSLEEKQAEAILMRAQKKLRENPERCSEMVTSLLALVVYMANGGDFDQWFLDAGIDPPEREMKE